MRTDQIRTKRPYSPLGRTRLLKLLSFVAGFTITNQMLVPASICELLGNNRRRKFTAVNSSAGTRVAVKSDCRIAAKLHPLRK